MKKAFTLIELLVVVLIIGILAAIALPQYQVAVAKARVMPLVSLMRSIDSAQQVYKLANGAYATDLADLDIQSPANIVPYQFISDGKAMSVGVSEPKSGISLEKYYNKSYFYCWVNKNNALQVKICQSISGKTTATGGDGGEIYSYYTF